MFRFKKMTFMIGLVAVIVVAVKKSDMLSPWVDKIPFLNNN